MVRAEYGGKTMALLTLTGKKVYANLFSELNIDSHLKLSMQKFSRRDDNYSKAVRVHLQQHFLLLNFSIIWNKYAT